MASAYYFIIIAIGIMFTLNLAGIDTGSHQLLDKFIGIGTNASVNINPDMTGTSAGDISSANNFWDAFKIFLVVALVLSAIGVAAGGQRAEAAVTAIMAGMGAIIWTMFAIDFLSILQLMYRITGGIGWEFNLTWIIIVPFLVGFAYSLIKLVQGTE